MRLSIPLWCDCNGVEEDELVGLAVLSIPLWCDCNLFVSPVPLINLTFNPTMVRLQQEATVALWEEKIAFNPTMVRLQPLKALQENDIEVVFQSHYGAIATAVCFWAEEAEETFNPTMVRLQPTPFCILAKPERPFNPTMVRLQPRSGGLAMPLVPPFNPTMVRLQRRYVIVAWR